MKLVVGLGNPGPRYAETRHNIGWRVLDELARRWNADVSREEKRFEGLLGTCERKDKRVLLLKPTTFMNLSGRSVASVCRFYKLAPADVLAVMDDLDLPVGRVRIRAQGSAGGQKGLADILRALSTQDVARVRLGIGRPDPRFASDYVLSRFTPDEREAIEHAVVIAADAIETWLSRGITAAMNEYNRRRDDESPRQ